MNPRIASMENLIASDPGGRGIFALALPDQLRLAAQSLRLARRVAIVSGFYIPEARGPETDGPPGAKVLGQALHQLGIDVDYLTDELSAPVFRALGIDPVLDCDGYLDSVGSTHLVAIERAGRGADGRYRNMRGIDITDTTASLDGLFLLAAQRGLTTIGIGDGGNEIGMGKALAGGAWASIPPTVALIETRESASVHSQSTLDTRQSAIPTTIVATDFCIVAGVSNWGALGLTGALSVLEGRDLLPPAGEVADDMRCIVREAGAVDGVTLRREPTTDGQSLDATLRMLEQIRRHVTPSPLCASRGDASAGGSESRVTARSPRPLLIGVLGYGETGRAAAALLAGHGHRVRISDHGPVTVDRGLQVAGVETGGHTVEFLADADVVVASPGVPLDSPILNELHRRGVYVMSELELSYQLLGCAGRPFGEAPGGAPPATGSRSDGEAGCLGRAKRGHADPTTADMPAASNAAESPTLIAVTGTVGKRTTVELLRRVWHAAGRTLRIGGNRGRPLSELLRDHDPTADIAVAVSSFQLETVVHFRPRVAVLLNLSDAHLDRHRSVAEYLRIKSRVFMNQQPDDALILPFDDPRLAALARKHAGRTFFVSARQPVDRGAWLVDGHLSMNIDGRFEEVGTADTAHPENLLATVLIARLCGITTDRIAEAVSALRDEGDAT